MCSVCLKKASYHDNKDFTNTICMALLVNIYIVCCCQHKHKIDVHNMNVVSILGNHGP
jgi:hypothetical protein